MENPVFPGSGAPPPPSTLYPSPPNTQDFGTHYWMVINEMNKLLCANQTNINASLDNNARMINEAISIKINAVNTHLGALDTRIQSFETAIDSKLSGLMNRMNSYDNRLESITKSQEGIQSENQILNDKLSSLSLRTNENKNVLDTRIQSLETTMDNRLSGIVNRMNPFDDKMESLTKSQDRIQSEKQILDEKLSSLASLTDENKYSYTITGKNHG